jgi:homoserine O-acetyltransferase
MIGPGKALDPEKHFIVCAGVIGSPYGDLSPLTIDPDTGRRYGSNFPEATVRDTVRLHRALLEKLGVHRVAFAIGSSLGAMQVLEWAFLDDYVAGLVAIAVGGRNSAWNIAWSESQRHCIYADPKWNGGDYDPAQPPADGLAAARMVAMLSYRSAFSYKERFGRELTGKNDPLFQMESYLRYQGRKLVDRFDAGCYVSMTRQMNRHDVSAGRGAYEDVLKTICQPTLVVGITSDILYPLVEQEELAHHLPNASLDVIESDHGHDAFLIELAELNRRVVRWRTEVLEPRLVDGEVLRCDAA